MGNNLRPGLFIALILGALGSLAFRPYLFNDDRSADFSELGGTWTWSPAQGAVTLTGPPGDVENMQTPDQISQQ